VRQPFDTPPVGQVIALAVLIWGRKCTGAKIDEAKTVINRRRIDERRNVFLLKFISDLS